MDTMEQPADQNPPPPPSLLMRPESRQTLWFWLLLFVLLGFSHVRNQGAWPEFGWPTAAGLGLVVLTGVGFGRVAGAPQLLLIWPVALFAALVIWATLTFAWSVSPAAGLETAGTWLEGSWVFCAAVLGWGVARRLDRADGPDAEPALAGGPRAVVATAIFVFFAAVAIASALKGLHQYAFTYDQLLADMERAGPPDPWSLEASLLHAFREKRVGSFYGNPNVHAALLALGLPFVLGLAISRRRVESLALWSAGLAPVFIALYLTKSRGGWLCAALALAVAYGLAGVRHRRRARMALALGAGLAAALCMVWALAIPGEGAAVPSSRPASLETATPAAAAVPEERREAGFWKRLTRVSTVRERAHYVAVAVRQLQESPWSWVIGNGLGSYGVLYQKTRPREARESQYAHNAPVQLWVEAGLPALILMLGVFALAIARASIRPAPGSCEGAMAPEGHPLVALLAPMAAAALAAFGLNALIDIAFFMSREFFLDGCLLAGLLAATAPPAPPGTGATPGRLRRALTRPAARWALFGVWAGANALGAAFYVVQPMRARAAYLLGNDLLRRSQFAGALEQYQRAASIQGNDARYLNAQASIHERLRRDEDALTMRAMAIRLDPHSSQLRRAQALLLLAMKRPDEALDHARKAVDLYPFHPQGHAVLGRVLAALGRRDEAAAELDRAAQLEPHHPELYRAERQRLLEGRAEPSKH